MFGHDGLIELVLQLLESIVGYRQLVLEVLGQLGLPDELCALLGELPLELVVRLILLLDSVRRQLVERSILLAELLVEKLNLPRVLTTALVEERMVFPQPLYLLVINFDALPFLDLLLQMSDFLNMFCSLLLHLADDVLQLLLLDCQVQNDVLFLCH